MEDEQLNDPREKLHHREARRVVEFYLMSKGETILHDNSVDYSDAFVIDNKLKKFRGHTYDIFTNQRIVEIDDLGQHSHKTQKINDGIAGKYAEENLGMPFHRLLKEEITNRRGHILDLDSVHSYLSSQLGFSNEKTHNWWKHRE